MWIQHYARFHFFVQLYVVACQSLCNSEIMSDVANGVFMTEVEQLLHKIKLGQYMNYVAMHYPY